MGTFITNIDNITGGDFAIYSTDSGDFTATIATASTITLSTDNLGGKTIDIAQFANAKLQIYDYSESVFKIIKLNRPTWTVETKTLDISNCINFVMDTTNDSINLMIPGPPRTVDTDLGVENTAEISPAKVWYTSGEQLVTSAQDITTSWVDMGNEIDVRGFTQLNLYVTLDINDGVDVRIKALGKHEFGGTDEFDFSIETEAASDIKIEPKYIEFNTDVDQLQVIKFETFGVPYIQIQVMAVTAGDEVTGETAAAIGDCYINKIWK